MKTLDYKFVEPEKVLQSGYLYKPSRIKKELFSPNSNYFRYKIGRKTFFYNKNKYSPIEIHADLILRRLNYFLFGTSKYAQKTEIKSRKSAKH